MAKIRGLSPKKFGVKNLQNLVQFYTTSDFDREYLRNNSRYPKSESQLIEMDSSRIRWNKSGELWSTIQKVGHVKLDRPKSIFRETIFRPLGGGPTQNFKGEIQNWA